MAAIINPINRTPPKIPKTIINILDFYGTEYPISITVLTCSYIETVIDIGVPDEVAPIVAPFVPETTKNLPYKVDPTATLL